MDSIFKQKKINHIFHYTESVDSLVKIINNGFAPSYCEEQITDLTYLIPMVSFCNISIREVDNDLRYGSYGIGMSLDWAIRNQISPVIYIHDNSPFARLHSNINEILLLNMVNKKLENLKQQIDIAIQNGEEFKYAAPKEDDDPKLLYEINQITVSALQFIKNWKTQHKGIEIVTYQEREWRFIPQLKVDKKIILQGDEDFELFRNKIIKPKPHLPQFALKINSMIDIRYIIIKTEVERVNLIENLNTKFGEMEVQNAILRGNFIILTEEQVKNDF